MAAAAMVTDRDSSPAGGGHKKLTAGSNSVDRYTD